MKIKEMKSIQQYVQLILVILILTACSSADLFTSTAAGDEIKIDGDRSDWKGKLSVLDDEKIALGFMNSEEYLYVCLTTNDRANIMKIVTQGLTIWFYPEDSDNIIGLNYPQQLAEFPQMEMRANGRQPDNNQNREIRINNLLQNQSEYSILDDDNNALFNYPVGSNNGFEVKVAYANNFFVYEAKIPLSHNNSSEIVVDVLPREILNVQFKTGKIDIDNVRNQMSSMGTKPDRGMGGKPNGEMSGGGQTGERPDQDSMKPLEFDLNVKLY